MKMLHAFMHDAAKISCVQMPSIVSIAKDAKLQAPLSALDGTRIQSETSSPPVMVYACKQKWEAPAPGRKEANAKCRDLALFVIQGLMQDCDYDMPCLARGEIGYFPISSLSMPD